MFGFHGARSMEFAQMLNKINDIGDSNLLRNSELTSQNSEISGTQEPKVNLHKSNILSRIFSKILSKEK